MRISETKLRSVIREEILTEQKKVGMLTKAMSRFKDQVVPAVKGFLDSHPDFIDDLKDLLDSITGDDEE